MSAENRKTHIVFLTDWLADLDGGAEKQILEVARRLDKNKYSVFIVSLDSVTARTRSLFEQAGCQLHIFRVVRIYGLSGFLQGIRFRTFLKNNHIDIVQTYHFSSDIWGTLWAHLAGVRAVVSNRRDMGFWRKPWHVWVYRIFNRWVKKIVVVTQSIKEMVMKTEGVAAERIEIIYNGVDLNPAPVENVRHQRASLGLGDQDLIVIHLANLKPVKGHEYLLKAFVGVVGELPQAKLLLIGQDDMNGSLQKQAQELKITDNVLFLGKRVDVSHLLPLADICVLPSLSEGMSNAILEYMANGKPVIATEVGGNPELIKNGFNGLLVPAKNLPELKTALLSLLHDGEKRQVMGNSGFLRVKNEFSMDAMMNRYERLLQEVTTSKGGLKVLHVVSSGGLFGAERVILNIVGQGNEVAYVGTLNNRHNPHLEIIKEAKKAGFKTVVFDSNGRLDIGTILSIKRFLLENHIDILHTHNYKSDIVGFWAAKLAGKKWVATNHVWHSTDSKLRFYERLDAMLLKSADKVIAVSDEIKEDLVKKKFLASHVEVVHNGIDIAPFQQKFPVAELRAALGISSQEVVVAIVGRLAPEKAHDIFLKAVQQVIIKNGNVKFLIVGDGPLREDLKKRVVELGLSDKVILTGIREDMPAVYALSDIMVNASYIEGLPMTILEAMAAKLAIIATPVGAVPNVIRHQRNGLLVAPGQVKELAEAIEYLVQNVVQRQKLAAQAYEDVCREFSAQRMAKEYHTIYEQVAG